MMILRESGQLITSVVLERSGLPVMPTNRVIPVIQVITVVTMLVTMKSMIIDVNDDQMIRRSTPLLLPPHPSCQSPCQADSRWPPSPSPSPSPSSQKIMPCWRTELSNVFVSIIITIMFQLSFCNDDRDQKVSGPLLGQSNSLTLLDLSHSQVKLYKATV